MNSDITLTRSSVFIPLFFLCLSLPVSLPLHTDQLRRWNGWRKTEVWMKRVECQRTSAAGFASTASSRMPMGSTSVTLQTSTASSYTASPSLWRVGQQLRRWLSALWFTETFGKVTKEGGGDEEMTMIIGNVLMQHMQCWNFCPWTKTHTSGSRSSHSTLKSAYFMQKKLLKLTKTSFLTN